MGSDNKNAKALKIHLVIIGSRYALTSYMGVRAKHLMFLHYFFANLFNITIIYDTYS